MDRRRDTRDPVTALTTRRCRARFPMEDSRALDSRAKARFSSQCRMCWLDEDVQEAPSIGLNVSPGRGIEANADGVKSDWRRGSAGFFIVSSWLLDATAASGREGGGIPEEPGRGKEELTMMGWYGNGWGSLGWLGMGVFWLILRGLQR